MSWQRALVNLALRLGERRYLARADDPHDIRARFERKARVWLRPPRGARLCPDTLVAAGRELPALRVGTGAAGAPVLLYFHGGGYVFGSPHSHAGMLARLCDMAGASARLPEYRLAPEHPYPAALDDARAAFAALVGRGVAADRIVLGGDSAGGGLALALLADLGRCGGPMPAGLFAFSPLTDLTFSGDSIVANAAADVLLPAGREREMARLYLQGGDPLQPGASPLWADFAGAPPVLLLAGDTEILLDDTRRMAARLAAQDVAVVTRIGHDLPHVWPILWRWLPEGDTGLRRTAGWIRQLPPWSGDS